MIFTQSPSFSEVDLAAKDEIAEKYFNRVNGCILRGIEKALKGRT